MRTDETLRKIQLFSGLSEPELRALSARAVLKTFASGERVFSEGEPCEGLHVVARGKLRIYKTSANGREQVLAEEGEGSSVAELPVLDGDPYPASAVALTDSETVFVSRRDFRDICMEHPEVALKVLTVVGGRLRRLVGIIEELSFTTVRHRLIAFLLRAAGEQGRKTTAGIEFELPGTHQQLAGQIGTVRELVSRNLKRLQAEQLIVSDGRHVVIPDFAALEREQESGT